jgi:hypothetical protein
MRVLRVLVLPGLLVGLAGGLPSAFAQPAAAIKVLVAVSPNPVTFNNDAYVSVATMPNALCSSSVVYNGGSVPTNWQSEYKNKNFKAARNGVVIWTWTQKKRGISGGKATVTCTSNGSRTSTTIAFPIK